MNMKAINEMTRSEAILASQPEQYWITNVIKTDSKMVDIPDTGGFLMGNDRKEVTTNVKMELMQLGAGVLATHNWSKWDTGSREQNEESKVKMTEWLTGHMNSNIESIKKVLANEAFKFAGEGTPAKVTLDKETKPTKEVHTAADDSSLERRIQQLENYIDSIKPLIKKAKAYL